MHQHACVVCASQFTSRMTSAKYCSKLCASRAFNAARRADGRLREQRTKRATQRAAYQANYRVAIACAVCGTPTTQKKGSPHRPTCGQLCKTYLRLGSRWPATDIPEGHPIRTTPIPDKHPCRCATCAHCERSFTINGPGQLYCSKTCSNGAAVARKRLALARFAAGSCRQCGTSFVLDRMAFSSLRDAFCSARCSSRFHKLQRRARERTAEWAIVSPSMIYERDGWRCHLCRRKIRRNVVVPHPLAATLDHVIPLSKGGGHTPANVRAAHFSCNSQKGNRGGGEQLALIG